MNRPLTFSEFRTSFDGNLRWKRRWKKQWAYIRGNPLYPHIGSRHVHITGIWTQHCAHQTALWPYQAFMPDGRPLPTEKETVCDQGGGFYATFRHIEDARCAAFVYWWNNYALPQILVDQYPSVGY